MNEQMANNRVSLTQIIDLGVQKTYHDLTVLAELLPRKTDLERKIEIVNFAERTRQLFLRLLALVKWAGGASKIEQCMDIVSFLDKQALLFINTADNMVNIARTTLVQARLPSFQLPCAVEVSTLGTYSRMPTCVRDRIVPPDPISLEEKKSTLARLDHIIEQRLSVSKIHPSMRNLKIEYGRVIFHVENEFDLKLTLPGDAPNMPWRVLGLELLLEDADTGEGKDLVNPGHVRMMEQIIQKRMNESATPLVDVFAKIHNFCLSLQIEVLHDQVERLIKDRFSSSIKIKEHMPGQKLSIAYWGFKHILTIQIDHQDLSRPLKLIHQPELTNDCNNIDNEKDDIFKPGHVSIEQLLATTIQQRAVIRLNQLANELSERKYGKCTISGTHGLLHVCCLDPCAASEELIISLDLNGSYLAHVPRYERNCPLADHIQESLNGNRSKLGTYFDQLKIWLQKKRCITTIDYLPVSANDSLPLGSKANHAKLDDRVPRLFFQFNKYNHYYLMAEFFTTDAHPFGVETRYSLLVTESVSNITGDGLDIGETDASVESVKRDLLIVENVLELDVARIIAHSYCYETNTQDRNSAFTSNLTNFKREIFHHKDETQYRMASYGYMNELSGSKPPVLLVSELPLLVSFCEEKLAHLALEKEFRNRNLKYEVSRSETSGFAYCIAFSKVPTLKSSGYSSALRRDTAVMMINLHEKPLSSKIWHCSYIFKNCPIVTQSRKEQSPKRFVFTPYESPLLNTSMVSKFIEDTQLDWACMAHLYDVVKEFASDIQNDPGLLDTISLRSFNYKKLVILYGDNRGYSITLFWKPTERKFHLIFGFIGGSAFRLNPHSLMAIHLKHEFNQHKSIKNLVNTLNVTLKPLLTLQSYPVYPLMGMASSRPSLPATSFCLVPLSSSCVKLIYRNISSIDITIQANGNLMVRDGSYSKFDRNKTMEDLVPICNFETLLYRKHFSTGYVLNQEEFNTIFQVQHLEKHLGMSFMIKNVLKKLSTPTWLPSARALTPSSPTAFCYASDNMQYRFSLDLLRGVVQMEASPIMNEDWTQDEIEVLQRYFETKVGGYPYKADPFLFFSRVLFNFPKNVVRDFIQLFKLELLSDHIDPNIQWNVSLCHLISAGTPFTGPSVGMACACPLTKVTLFVLQLTRRGSNNPLCSSVYLPLTYDTNQNILSVFPSKMENPPTYLSTIANHLKSLCEKFKASGNPGCVIYYAIQRLISSPNLIMT